MGARAYLRHMARIHGLADLSVIDPLLERLALVGGPAAPLRTLSKGNAQKVGLAQAVMVRPDLLILDEPWSGLDVGTHAILGELVAETRARGASVVFTDHRPQVVHDHADVVHLMNDGRLTAESAEPTTRIVLRGHGTGWADEPGVRHAVVEGAARRAHGRGRLGRRRAAAGVEGRLVGAGGGAVLALTRYYLALLGHSQRYLPALLAYLALCVILYADPHSPPLPLFGVSAGGLLVVSCWLTIALLDIEDPVQRLVTLSHARQWRRMITGAILTVLAFSVVLTVITEVWSALKSFKVQPSALGIGLLAHLACALLGIAIALPCSRLLVQRIGWTVLAAVITLIVVLLAKIPLVHPLLHALTDDEPVGGPLVLARGDVGGGAGRELPRRFSARAPSFLSAICTSSISVPGFRRVLEHD